MTREEVKNLKKGDIVYTSLYTFSGETKRIRVHCIPLIVDGEYREWETPNSYNWDYVSFQPMKKTVSETDMQLHLRGEVCIGEGLFISPFAERETSKIFKTEKEAWESLHKELYEKYREYRSALDRVARKIL